MKSSTARTAGSLGRCIVFALLALVSGVLGPARPATGSSTHQVERRRLAAATIQSTGPLTDIVISGDLTCAVSHASDSYGEWYGDTACATLVAAEGALYGPVSIPAGNAATSAPGYVAYTPISQHGPTGTGSPTDPLTVTTVVGLGESGMQLMQTDSYVLGQETYRTDVTLTTTTGRATPVTVYRAGDCYLQDSDWGYGNVHNGTAPVCKALPTSADPNRIEGLYPLTPGSRHLQTDFNAMWAAIGTQQPLANTCRCSEEIDNGIALSWSVVVPATGASTTSSLTMFSPVGASPVAFTKTADASVVAPNAANGYTVTLANPGIIPQRITQVVDSLPPGFSYVPGSSTGAITSDPIIAGSTLTWTVPVFVPAASRGVPGSATFHFGVTGSAIAGTYTNTVTGSGVNVSVLGADDVAPVTVVAPGANLAPSGSAGGPYTGTRAAPVPIVGVATDPESDPLTTTWSVTADDAAGCLIADSAALSTTIACDSAGVYPVVLRFTDNTHPLQESVTSVSITDAPSIAVTAEPKPATAPQAPAPAPGALSVSPATVDFGSGPFGVHLADIAVTVANTGGSPVAITSSALTAATDSFVLVDEACTGVVLAPGGTCRITVGSTPVRGGETTSTLTVAGAGVAPAIATLHAVGLFVPSLMVRPGVVAAGSEVRATGTGFPPGATIQLTYEGQSAVVTGTADDTGALNLPIAMPPTVRAGGQVLIALEQPGRFSAARATFVIATPHGQPFGSASPAITGGIRPIIGQHH